jgi:hypothetical protein
LLFVPLLLVGTFVCLFPLSLYCLFLAGLNNRPRPTLVAGTWDFAWVLVATAGFWVFGGPALLVGLHDKWRQYLFRGSFAAIRDALDAPTWPWLVAWAGYFFLLVAGAAWLIRRRRPVTVIYHIGAEQAQATVVAALDRLGWSWARTGSGYAIGIPAGKGPALSDDPAGRVALDVAPAPGLRTVTLRWSGDAAHRPRFEEELDRVLDEVQPPENPAVGWLLTVATVLFTLMLFSAALFAVFVWSLRS